LPAMSRNGRSRVSRLRRTTRHSEAMA
jgi:hypothetical protein